MSHHHIGVVDPFAQNEPFWHSFTHAVLATAIFRCWHILLFFATWSTAVCLISNYVHNLGMQSTLLTVLGTVLGFVISYRTTSSFERYNEGRRLWSQIILNTRTFARLVWFHASDEKQDNSSSESPEQFKARTIIEKKTVLNLLEAFSVSVKHYLRGEEGINYEDLFHLVRFLPVAYTLPPGMPSTADLSDLQSLRSRVSTQHPPSSPLSAHGPNWLHAADKSPIVVTTHLNGSSAHHLPLPASTPGRSGHVLKSVPKIYENKPSEDGEKKFSTGCDHPLLSPARDPPEFTVWDVFPFSLFVHLMTEKGVDIKGKKVARMKAKLQGTVVTHNLPLGISLYLSSYIGALSKRKAIDAPTYTAFNNALTALVDALTGLERILTTPIPFSYSVHLWLVTLIYCFFLPFQIWPSLKWLTIPGTTIVAFIFFGFLVAGEEIENPFGYDKNDLNMDHFTHHIIRNELRAITAVPAPDPAQWVFSPLNDHVFASGVSCGEPTERGTPQQWMERGLDRIQVALSMSAIAASAQKLPCR